MTKTDLIEAVSRGAELTRVDAEAIIDLMLESFVRALRSGEEIEIRGFGSFGTRQRQPLTGRTEDWSEGRRSCQTRSVL